VFVALEGSIAKNCVPVVCKVFSTLVAVTSIELSSTRLPEVVPLRTTERRVLLGVVVVVRVPDPSVLVLLRVVPVYESVMKEPPYTAGFAVSVAPAGKT
jgi:hypothetical protein